MTKELKTERINFALKPSTVKKLELIAKKESRSKTSVIENLINIYTL